MNCINKYICHVNRARRARNCILKKTWARRPSRRRNRGGRLAIFQNFRVWSGLRYRFSRQTISRDSKQSQLPQGTNRVKLQFTHSPLPLVNSKNLPVKTKLTIYNSNGSTDYKIAEQGIIMENYEHWTWKSRLKWLATHLFWVKIVMRKRFKS